MQMDGFLEESSQCDLHENSPLQKLSCLQLCQLRSLLSPHECEVFTCVKVLNYCLGFSETKGCVGTLKADSHHVLG